MLVLEQACIQYPGLSIDYPDIHIKPYEFVGIAGKSGCGKTSLLEALFGINFAGTFHYAKAQLAGQDLVALGERKRRWVSYCPQFSQNALNPRLTMEQHLLLTLKGNDLPYDPVHIERLLQQLKLSTDLLGRYPSMLSGGQKQRFVLFFCAVKQPRLLVLDEPSSAIDLITLRSLVEFLSQMRGQTTVLMVAHNWALLRRVADRLILLSGER